MSGGRWLLIAPVMALLGACASSPRTEFFTLVAIPAQQSRRVIAGGSVQVAAVHIPDILDRPQRVIAGRSGRLLVLEEEQWGAPLGEMIRRVLSEDLAARLPPGAVLAPQMPRDRSTRRIVVDVEEFQPDAGGRVLLRVSWTVIGGQTPGRTDLLTRSFTLQAGKGADSQVRAMSVLLARVADAIIAHLARPASGADARQGIDRL